MTWEIVTVAVSVISWYSFCFVLLILSLWALALEEGDALAGERAVCGTEAYA
jgi:hypothetical protein